VEYYDMEYYDKFGREGSGWGQREEQEVASKRTY
jgi:hypothetical protein